MGGEYLALTVAIEDLAAKTSNTKAKALAAALDKAVGKFLVANKNPSRKVREIDNRGSHYWVARYWAEELAEQDKEGSMKATFAGVAKADAAMRPVSTEAARMQQVVAARRWPVSQLVI